MHVGSRPRTKWKPAHPTHLGVFRGAPSPPLFPLHACLFPPTSIASSLPFPLLFTHPLRGATDGRVAVSDALLVGLDLLSQPALHAVAAALNQVGALLLQACQAILKARDFLHDGLQEGEGGMSQEVTRTQTQIHN